MLTELLLFSFIIILLIFLCYFVLAFFTGAPFVWTPSVIVDEMIRIAAIKKKDVVVDMGSGDGRLLIAAAQKGAIAKGWEINPILVLWTIVMAKLKKVDKTVSVFWKSYLQADLRDATIVMFYNIPQHLPALEKKLFRELKPGTTIISYQFPLNKFILKKQTHSGIFIYKTK